MFEDVSMLWVPYAKILMLVWNMSWSRIFITFWSFQYAAKVENHCSKIHLEFSHLQNRKKKKNPCSLPSLPHKDIEGKGENNWKVLVLWMESAIKSQRSVLFQFIV